MPISPSIPSLKAPGTVLPLSSHALCASISAASRSSLLAPSRSTTILVARALVLWRFSSSTLQFAGKILKYLGVADQKSQKIFPTCQSSISWENPKNPQKSQDTQRSCSPVHHRFDDNNSVHQGCCYAVPGRLPGYRGRHTPRWDRAVPWSMRPSPPHISQGRTRSRPEPVPEQKKIKTHPEAFSNGDYIICISIYIYTPHIYNYKYIYIYTIIYIYMQLYVCLCLFPPNQQIILYTVYTSLCYHVF